MRKLIFSFVSLQIEESTKSKLLCHLGDIRDISNFLINTLKYEFLKKQLDADKISACFLKNSEKIKEVYSHYAQYIRDSMMTVNPEKVIVIKSSKYS